MITVLASLVASKAMDTYMSLDQLLAVLNAKLTQLDVAQREVRDTISQLISQLEALKASIPE